MIGNYFVKPDLLWLLLALIPFAYVLVRLEHMRLRRAKLVSNPNQQMEKGINRWRFMPLAILGVLIVVLARPFIGSSTIEMPASTHNLIVLLDISKSMLAKDISPSRLEFSKRKLRDLVESARQKSRARIGIILFSGESYLYCPLTEDYAVLDHFIRSISTDLITNQGTSIKDAVETARRTIEEVGSGNAALILLSDGEDELFQPAGITQGTAEDNPVIHALGIGTPQGAPIPDSLGGYIKDERGNIVISKLQEGNLRALAERTGGYYSRAVLSNSDIEHVLNSVSDQGDAEITGKSITIYNEIGPLILIPLLLFMLSLIIIRKEALIFCWICLVLPLASVKAEEEPSSPAGSLYEAQRQYEAGNFPAALKSFKRHYQENPEDLKIAHGYAAALYKSGKYSEAEEIFERIKEKSVTGREKFEAAYNAANARFQIGDYKGAAAGYREALNINPNDENSAHNLELALKMIKQATPTPTPTPSSTGEDNDQKQNEESSENEEKSESDKEAQSDEKEEKAKQDGKSEQNDSESGGDAGSESNDGQSREETGSIEGEPEARQSEPDDDFERKPMSEEALKESEAKAWLESLPESPLLLRRKNPSGPRRSRQSW